MKYLTTSKLGLVIVLGLSALSCFAMIYFGWQFWDSESPEFANAFTGAGAVLAASISALVAFRTISIAEDAQRPYPYPYIDTQSRYGLSLLKIKNAGGSAARHIYIQWDGETPRLKQGNNEEGVPINFACDAAHAVSVLMPGDEQATFLGVHHWVAARLKGLGDGLKGHIVYRDAKDVEHRNPFFVDTSFYEWALADETELLRAQHAVTKLPEALEKVSKAIVGIGEKT